MYHGEKIGVEVDGEGRVLLWYKDEFGRQCSKHLLFCNGTQVEFRQPHVTVTCGTVICEEGRYYIRIDLPDYKA